MGWAGVAAGAMLVLSGLGLIFGRRIAGSNGKEMPLSDATRLFAGVALVVVGHQVAAHSAPRGAIGPVIPLGLAWIPGVLIAVGLAANVWMDRRGR